MYCKAEDKVVNKKRTINAAKRPAKLVLPPELA
jgi:hypothetical protein